MRKNDCNSPIVGSGSDAITSSTEDEKILLSLVHELMAELNVLFERAAERKYVNRELVLSLQTHLKNYSRIKNSSFLAGITILS